MLHAKLTDTLVTSLRRTEKFGPKIFPPRKGEFMYLLFGPALAGVLVIGFIQLRDQFMANR
jgi:hypothetical protein